MIRQGQEKVPAGLRLSPKGNKYRRWDSIIRSLRIVCGAYAFAPLQTGLRPSTLFSFSFLDERKGGKRKSRRQGRRPNLPGTGCVHVMYQANFPSPGRGRQGRRPNLPGTGCVNVMYQAHLPSPGRGRQGRRPNLPGTLNGTEGHRPNQAHPPHLPRPRQRP